MVATIFIVFFTLMGLIVLHELGHFVFAKKFGVKVEEFGIFLPPRIWGKKFGETLYSVNWIPAGAFVKLQGEDDNSQKDERSFAAKPIWQRMIIVAAGVVSFWIISAVILSFNYMSGAMVGVGDNDPAENARVQVIIVAGESPALSAGLEMGDIIEEIAFSDDPENAIEIDKVAQVQEISQNAQGRELILQIKRAGESFDVPITPRQNPPAGEGSMGVALARIAQQSYSLLPAIGAGITTTWNMTASVFDGWGQIIGRLVKRENLPAGTQLVGPVGIMEMMAKQAQMGWNYYLQFTAMISVYLAVFNALPIPALDGGRLMFLALEAIRRKPVSEKIEQTLTAVFFGALMLFAIIVTVQDVIRLF